jgi:hypothetical protein
MAGGIGILGAAIGGIIWGNSEEESFETWTIYSVMKKSKENQRALLAEQ